MLQTKRTHHLCPRSVAWQEAEEHRDPEAVQKAEKEGTVKKSEFTEAAEAACSTRSVCTSAGMSIFSRSVSDANPEPSDLICNLLHT